MTAYPRLHGSTLRWGGHKSQSLTKRVLWAAGGICWLCGKPGADTADHILPRKDFPEFTWAITNLRAAHKRCNTIRGNTNASRYSRPDWLDELDHYGIGDDHPAVRAALAGLGVDTAPAYREPATAATTIPTPVQPKPAARPAWGVI